jgi:hypothetical protein
MGKLFDSLSKAMEFHEGRSERAQRVDESIEARQKVTDFDEYQKSANEVDFPDVDSFMQNELAPDMPKDTFDNVEADDRTFGELYEELKLKSSVPEVNFRAKYPKRGYIDLARTATFDLETEYSTGPETERVKIRPEGETMMKVTRPVFEEVERPFGKTRKKLIREDTWKMEQLEFEELVKDGTLSIVDTGSELIRKPLQATDQQILEAEGLPDRLLDLQR